MVTASSDTKNSNTQRTPLNALPSDKPDIDANEATDTKTDVVAEDADLPFLDGAIQTTFWDDLRDSLPTWLDELIAIALLIFGVLSFLALFFPAGAVAAVTWSNILRGLFGDGSPLVAVGLFVLGIVILLPKIGIHIKYSPARVLAIEAIFLCVLAILHVLPAQEELRSLARNGTGGGIVGWGLTAFSYWLLGRGATITFYIFVILVSLAALIGLRRKHVVNWLDKLGERLLIFSARWSGAAERITMPEMTVPTSKILELSTREVPLMRIVQDIDNLPPSVRARIAAQEAAKDIDLSTHPLFNTKGKELKLDVNIIGEATKEKADDGTPLVRRPDGRMKRYFSVSAMKEDKVVGRRSKFLPSLDLLSEEEMTMPEDEEINHKVVLIENTLLEFDVDIDVVNVQVGPTVTRYALQPYRTNADGTTERTRLGKIASYHNDLSLALSAKRLRLEIPVPGTKYMGIEVPNAEPSVVTLRSVIESRTFYEKSQKSPSPLTIPLGRDVSGNPVALDIAKMPHLLIAGTTGSGKSVCIAAIASALLLNNKPDKVKLVMLDPKMVELSRFNGIPHLMGPVETDTERIIGVLKWCTMEMDRRYKLLEEHAVRNIDGYNEKYGKRRRGKDHMPHVVIMIDEIGDLMMSQPEETERAITRLAQMARAVGMHLIIATQRPSVDVITGLIKANFPGRIAFSVASGVDSRVILDTVGAEHLMGRGDMLYLAPESGSPIRVQGCHINDEEVRTIVEHWQNWYEEQIESGDLEKMRSGPWQRGLTRREFLAETDPMLEDAIEYVVRTQEASASLIQRELNLGYPRAARIIDMLEEIGVVGEQVGGGRARRVLIPKGEDPFKRIIDGLLERDRKRKAEQDNPDNEIDLDIDVLDIDDSGLDKLL